MAYPRNVADANKMFANGEITKSERDAFFVADKAMKTQGTIGLGARLKTAGIGANGRTRTGSRPDPR